MPYLNKALTVGENDTDFVAPSSFHLVLHIIYNIIYLIIVRRRGINIDTKTYDLFVLL